MSRARLSLAAAVVVAVGAVLVVRIARSEAPAPTSEGARPADLVPELMLRKAKSELHGIR